MAMRVLVVGGTGMLGEPVVRSLASSGHTVCVLSRHPERVAERFAGLCELARGDVEDKESLARALEGCAAVHVSLNGAGDWDFERRGAEAVASLAPKAGVQRLSLISGASTCAENAWSPIVRAKLAAEDAVRASGVPFTILRCPMFMETLRQFVRDGMAVIMGRQPHPWHWIAASDYAALVVRALELPEAAGKVLHVRGPQALTLEAALEVYRKICAPEAKLMRMPFWMARVMGLMPGRRELRRVALPLMTYFSRVTEVGDPGEANALLGAPSTTLEAWCRQRAAPPPRPRG